MFIDGFLILSFYLSSDAMAIRQSHYFMFWAKFCAWKNCHIFCFHLIIYIAQL